MASGSSGGTWNKEETLSLIEIWGDDRIQAQLEGAHRNRNVYLKIARQMSEAGYQRTLEQCRDKIKKLKGEYREVKDKGGKTGEGRNNWEYFEAMDSILGHKPATHPPVVIDTMAEGTGPAEEEEELSTASNEVAYGVLNVASPSTSRAGTPAPSVSRAVTPAPSTSRAGTPAPSVSRAGTPAPSTSRAEPTSRKRKRNKAENVVGDLLQNVLDAHS